MVEKARWAHCPKSAPSNPRFNPRPTMQEILEMDGPHAHNGETAYEIVDGIIQIVPPPRDLSPWERRLLRLIHGPAQERFYD